MSPRKPERSALCARSEGGAVVSSCCCGPGSNRVEPGQLRPGRTEPRLADETREVSVKAPPASAAASALLYSRRRYENHTRPLRPPRSWCRQAGPRGRRIRKHGGLVAAVAAAGPGGRAGPTGQHTWRRLAATAPPRRPGQVPVVGGKENPRSEEGGGGGPPGVHPCRGGSTPPRLGTRHADRRRAPIRWDALLRQASDKTT